MFEGRQSAAVTLSRHQEGQLQHEIPPAALLHQAKLHPCGLSPILPFSWYICPDPSGSTISSGLPRLDVLGRESAADHPQTMRDLEEERWIGLSRDSKSLCPRQQQPVRGLLQTLLPELFCFEEIIKCSEEQQREPISPFILWESPHPQPSVDRCLSKSLPSEQLPWMM